MNRKQLTILLVLLVILGGLGLAAYKRTVHSWAGATEKSEGKILNLPLNDVAQIHVKQAAAEVTLAKKNEIWTVRERADYAADFEQVSAAIRKFWELKPVQEVKVGPSQLARLDLAEPGQDSKNAGTRVEFKDKDGKPLASILLGKQQMRSGDGTLGESPGFAVGRYVMADGNPPRVSLVSETFSDIEPKPEKWLDHTFFRIEKVKSIAFTGSSPAMTWKLTRDDENGDWKLAGAKPGEQLDSAKTSAFATLFASPNFVDVLPPDATPETTGLATPSVATFMTFDNFDYSIKIGKLSGENYPIALTVNATFAMERPAEKDEKPDEKKKRDEEFQARLKQLEEKLANEKKFEQRTYVIPKYSVDPLLKERAQLLAEKKPEPTPTPAPTTPGASATTPPVRVPAATATPALSPAVEVTTPPVAAPTPSPGPAQN